MLGTCSCALKLRLAFPGRRAVIAKWRPRKQGGQGVPEIVIISSRGKPICPPRLRKGSITPSSTYEQPHGGSASPCASQEKSSKHPSYAIGPPTLLPEYWVSSAMTCHALTLSCSLVVIMTRASSSRTESTRRGGA